MILASSLLAAQASSQPSPGGQVALGAHLNGGDEGIEIAEVVANGTAEALGIRPGDVLESMNGQRIARLEQLTETLASLKVGDPVKVVVRRNGKAVELAGTARARPAGFQTGIIMAPGQDAQPQAPAGPARPITQEALSQVDDYFHEQAAADEFSGAVLIADKGGTIFERSYGLATPDRKVTPDTRFNLASVDKFLTRIAILQLVQTGKLSMNDKVGKIVPDYPNADVREKVTVEQLFFNRAGIPNFWNERFFEREQKLRTTDDYLALFADQPLDFEPGTNAQYSNGGYVLLGKIIEQVSGLPYIDYVRRNILDPAGMRDTGHFTPGVETANRAYPYTRAQLRGEEAPPKKPRWQPSRMRHRGAAHGAGYSTVRDFAKLDRALRSGKLLDAGHRALLLGKDFDKGAGPGAGWAGGTTGGASTQFVMMPDGLTIIIFTNRDEGLAERSVRKVGELLGRPVRTRGPFS